MQKTKILISILFALAIISAIFCPIEIAKASDEYSYSTLVTGYGAAIPIAYLQSADTDEDYPSCANFSSAIRIGNGSKKYNCYTYSIIFSGHIADISQNSNNEIFAIEDASGLIVNNPCLTRVNFNQVAANDLVMYQIIFNNTEYAHERTYVHSGIVYEKGTSLESTVVVSKWGKYAVYRHNLTDNPYMGTSYQLNNMNPPIERIIGFSFFRVNHSYSYIIKYDSALPYAMSSHHKAICSDCGVFHYELHSYINQNNYIVCQDCEYNTNIMINGGGSAVIQSKNNLKENYKKEKKLCLRVI